MPIEKKCWPEGFRKILGGEKTFDIRLADFGCKPGDVLVLKEWDPKTKQYTGRKLEKKITFVSKINELKFWEKENVDKHGLQVIGFK